MLYAARCGTRAVQIVLLQRCSGRLSKNQLNRLQSVLHAATRLIFAAHRRDHVTPLLRQLHWLSVPERVEFKLCVLAYRCLHGLGPAYLSCDLKSVSNTSSRQRLRSASTTALVVSATRRSTLGDRAFRLPLSGSGMPCRTKSL